MLYDYVQVFTKSSRSANTCMNTFQTAEVKKFGRKHMSSAQETKKSIGFFYKYMSKLAFTINIFIFLKYYLVM